MEEFEKIDWLPNIEDMVDDEFINETNFERNSATHKILNGIFLDPFSDIRPSYYKSQLKKNPDKNKPSVEQTVVKKPRGRKPGRKKKQNKNLTPLKE